ncbi:hypothetical protein ACHHYP_00613 [Achlya hypogyna]|uniref:Uncharacterized protein n=1 Tax=Achlya hypogyna TaxID=1202772 RepID=A0A1V9ZU78_ACHHY|nr:hypothetical protein ACHHYP_00613 [Achlya hypogyna]
MLPELVGIIAGFVADPVDLFVLLRALPRYWIGPLFEALLELADFVPIAHLWPRLHLPPTATGRISTLLHVAMAQHPCVIVDVDSAALWAAHVTPSTQLSSSIDKSAIDTLPASILRRLVSLDVTLDTTIRLEFLWTCLDSLPPLELLRTDTARIASAGFSFPRGGNVSLATINALDKYLRSQGVRSVHLRGMRSAPETAAILSRAIGAAPILEHLSLYDAPTLVVALATADLTRVRQLTLNDVSWLHVETLWAKLPRLPLLRELDLWIDHGRLNDDEFSRFVAVVRSLHLTRFSLHAKNLLLNYPERDRVLLAAIANHHHLTSLALHFVMLGNDGIALLRQALPSLPRLAQLDLRYNAYDDRCLPQLQAIVARSQWTRIDLADTLSTAAEEALQAAARCLHFDAKCGAGLPH